MTKSRLVLLGILLFAFGFPLVGFLISWRDVHVRIERSAAEFVRKEAVPILMRWEKGELMEHSTVKVADRLRDGDYEKVLAEFGRLTKVTDVALMDPRAKETDDQGMMYAGAVIRGLVGEKSVTVRLELRNVTADNEWEFDGIEFEAGVQ